MRKEERDKLSTVMLDSLDKIEKLDVATKEWKDGVEGVKSMIEVANTADQIDEKWVDNAERRRIDEKKSDDMVKVETKKQKLTPGKVALEITKIGLPLAVSTGLYLVVHKENLKFEETGRFCAFTTKDLKLPNPFKWR